MFYYRPVDGIGYLLLLHLYIPKAEKEIYHSFEIAGARKEVR